MSRYDKPLLLTRIEAHEKIRQATRDRIAKLTKKHSQPTKGKSKCQH